MRKTLAKIAKAARSLSDDCVKGTAPVFGTGRPWLADEGGNVLPYCALGHVYHRAGLGPDEVPYERVPDSGGMIVWETNDNTPEEDRHAALVFPLLAFADACEAA